LLVVLGILVSAASGQEGAPTWKLSKPFTQKWVTTAKQTVTPEGGKAKDAAELSHEVTLNILWTPVVPQAKPADGKEKGDASKEAAPKDPKPAEPKKEDPKGKKDPEQKGQKPADPKKEDPKNKKAADPKPAASQPKQLELVLKIQGGTVRASVGSGQVNLDLEKPGDDKNPLAAALNKCLGAECKATLQLPSMKVLKVEVPQTGLPAEQQALLKDLLSEDTLRRQVELAFPELPLKKGDSTTRSQEFKVAGLGTYTLKTTYTHDGVKDNLILIKVHSDGLFTPAGAGKNYQVKAADKGKISADGSITFDPGKGLVEQSTLSFKDVARHLNLVIGKEVTQVKVVGTYTSTVEATNK
jgi:hypothetical protein